MLVYRTLEARRQVTVSGLNAYEAIFDAYGWSKEVQIYLMAGQNSYHLVASTDIDRGVYDSLNLAVEHLESILYSFDPGPDGTQPVPPQPPNSRLQHSESETLHLSDGSKLFQGQFTNNDSYWWATDIAVNLQLKNASGIVLEGFKVMPDNERLQPEERTSYEIRVPQNPPAWETSQISFTWGWSLCKGCHPARHC